MSRKDCNINKKCKAMPLTTTTITEKTRYNEHIKANAFKTIYQGQPSDIQIQNILSDSARITFKTVGKPNYYELTFSAASHIKTYIADSNTYNAIGLTPDTTYEVNIVAYYVSGDTFTVNHNATFHTLDKWKVPSVSYFYPSNQTIIVNDNFNHIPIDVSFATAPGFPTNYVIRVEETNTNIVIDTSYLEPLLYKVYLRNDISNTFHIITQYYNDPEYIDVSFVYSKVLPPFEEGTFAYDLTIDAFHIDVSYSQLPSYTQYNLILEKNGKQVKTHYGYTTGEEKFTNLIPKTNYFFGVSTYYSSSRNTYINGNTENFNTLDRTPIQNVDHSATNTSLNITFDSPSGNFLPHPSGNIISEPSSYFTVVLRNSFDEDVSNISYPRDTKHVSYADLSINCVYTFIVTAYYDGNGYIFEDTYSTLYENIVQDISLADVTGTSVTVKYSSFSNSSIPSNTDYYIIEYKDISTSNVIELITYNEEQHLYNLLDPNVNYEFSITSVYASNNKYKTIAGSFTTQNEGPVSSIAIDDIKGNRVDLNWNFYPYAQSPNNFTVRVYTEDNSLLSTIDISSSTRNRQFPSIDDTFDISHNKNYRFSFTSYFSEKNYERSIVVKTDNEFPIQILQIIGEGTSIEIRKTDVNNQDNYMLVRTTETNDLSTFIWTAQDISSNTNKTTYFAGTNNTLYDINMSKDHNIVLFFPNKYEIEVYKKETETVNIENVDVAYILTHVLKQTVCYEKVIYSTSINYDGTIFVVGFDDNTIDIYDFIYDSIYDSCRFVKRITKEVKQTTSRNVVINPIGNICAVSNEHLRDNIYIVNLDTGDEFIYEIPGLNKDQWYETIVNKYVQFDNSGNHMMIGVDILYQPSNGESNHYSYVKTFKINENAQFHYTDLVLDISGSRISLNKSFTNVAVVDNYDICNNEIVGSVSIYDICNNVVKIIFQEKFWGSSDSLKGQIYRDCSISDNGRVLSISESNYSYKNPSSPNFDGQIILFEKTPNDIWQSRGDPIRQLSDIFPSEINDRIITGEWFGYNMILDADGTHVLTSTRPKTNMRFSIDQGRSFLYKWQNPAYQYPIYDWPLIIDNLEPSTQYEFTINSTYNVDIGYGYPFRFSASTLSNQKPVVTYSISNESIGIFWNPVPRDEETITLFYSLLVKQGNHTVIDISFLDYYETQSSNPRKSYFIENLDFNTPYFIKFASEYTNKYIQGNDTQIIPTQYAVERTVSTLNESPVFIDDILSLNIDNLMVLQLINTGQEDISENIVYLKHNDEDLSYTLVNQDVLDLDFVKEGDTITGNILSIYQNQEQDGFFIFNNSTYFSDDFQFTNVSGEYVHDYFDNPTFDACYNVLLNQQRVRRFNVDRSRNIYRVKPKKWELESNYVYTIENDPNVDYSVQKYLETDVSYHALLYRSQDLIPGSSTPPSNLSQFLNDIVYSFYFDHSLYLSNQDANVQYNVLQNTFFSDNIPYKIEFSENDEIFYETSPIFNTDISFNKLSLKVHFTKSRKNVKYTFRRLDNQYNNLIVSDLSLNHQPSTFNTTPFWKNDASWNLLSTDIETTWKNTWYEEDQSYNVIKLSCNMSIALWAYVHYTDISQCVFLIGTDISNGTPALMLDNSNCFTVNNYADSSYNFISNSSYNSDVPNHFVVTYYNNEISVYINGDLIQQNTAPDTIREAYSNYNIYLGNPIDVSMGTTVKSIEIYDHKLEPETVTQLYDNVYLDYQQIGNAFDLSQNKEILYNDSISNSVSVQLPIHGSNSLQKDVSIDGIFTKSNVVNVSVSLWSKSDSSITIDGILNYYTDDNVFHFMNTMMPLRDTVNHFTMLLKSQNIDIYVNGYYYASIPNAYTSYNIIATNVGEVILYNTLFTQSECLTAYYNYYKLYSRYDLSGFYNIFLEYPKNSNNIDLSYEIINLPTGFTFSSDSSGIFYFNTKTVYTSFDVSNISITMDEYTLNKYNKENNDVGVIIPEYNIFHNISIDNPPYIDYTFNNIQYLTESITIEFRLKNVDDNYSYQIDGEITGSDLDYGSNISGTMIKDTSITIKLSDDIDIEDMELLLFRVPELNLATRLEIYDPIFFISTSRTSAFDQVFTITLRKTVATHVFSYQITGVQPEDINNADISGTIVFETKDISNVTTAVDCSLSTIDISFTVTADPTFNQRKYNLNFLLTLTDNDYNHVDILVILNDFFNVYSSRDTNTINNTILKEGESFTVYINTPYYITDGTEFNYVITGISAEDLYQPADISGTISVTDLSGSKTFQIAYDKYNDISINEILTFTVDGSGTNSSGDYYNFDLDLSFIILNIPPVFRFSGPQNVTENSIFVINLHDLSNNLPDGTHINYNIVSTNNSIVNADDIDNMTGSFNFQDFSGNVSFEVKGDRITEGGETFSIKIEDYPDIIWDVIIEDTSRSPLYFLSSTAYQVNEGDTFVIELLHENIPDGTVVDFTITGITRPDLWDLLSLEDSFTIPHDISRSYTVRNDVMTEDNETVRFQLTDDTNPIIYVDVDISDSSQSPKYAIDMQDRDVDGTKFSFNNGEFITISLDVENISTYGAQIGFKLSDLSLNDITQIFATNQNSLRYVEDDSAYLGFFTIPSTVNPISTNSQTSFTFKLNTPIKDDSVESRSPILSLVGDIRFFFGTMKSYSKDVITSSKQQLFFN